MLRIETDTYDSRRDAFEVSDGLIISYFPIDDLVWLSRGGVPRWTLSSGGLSRYKTVGIKAKGISLSEASWTREHVFGGTDPTG